MNTDENLTIRMANADDAKSIAQILRAIGDFAHINLEPEAETENRIKLRLLHSQPSHDQIFVAILNNVVCGYGAARWMQNLILNGIDGYLSELFIHPDHSGKNIGTKIIDKFREEARLRGAERLWCINLKDRNSYSRGFYKKLGWEERNIAVFMERQVTPRKI